MQPVVVLEDGTRLPAAEGARAAITLQDNDLTKPDSIQASYSTTFTLPDSQAVRLALGLANLGTSPTRTPYQLNKAGLELAGMELLPRGLLQLLGYRKGAGFEVQQFGGNKEFYAALGEKKLRQLQLGGSHPWNLASVAAGLATPADSWQGVYCYDVADRGRGVPEPANSGETVTPWNIYAGEMWPSVYARAIWEQIFTEAGYTWAGELPSSFNRLVLPAPVPYGYSEETIKQNTLVWGWQHSNRINAGAEGIYIYQDKTSFELTIPLNYAGPDSPFVRGSGITAEGDSVVLSRTGYYDLAGALEVYTQRFAGKQGSRLMVQGYVGGEGPAVTFCEDFARTSSSGTTTQHSCSSERVYLPAGTRLWLRFKGTQESDILLEDFWRIGTFIPAAPASTPMLESQQQASLSVTLLPDFPEGEQINPADWLPQDITQKEFIKQIVLLYGLTQKPHPYLNRMDFYPTGPAIVASLAAAPAWDARIDSSRPAQVRYQLPGFAQLNYLRWKEDSTNWASNDPEGTQAQLLGRGSLACQDETLEPSKDLYTLAFAATPKGQQALPLIPRWKLLEGAAPGSTAPEDYEQAEAQARLLLRSPAGRYWVSLADNEGHTQTVEAVRAYFVEPAEAEDLDLARRIPQYYQHLAAALQAPRILTPYIRLQQAEALAFNQGQAVWIEAEGAYFYVNKLNQYEPSQPSTPAELIRLLF